MLHAFLFALMLLIPAQAWADPSAQPRFEISAFAHAPAKDGKVLIAAPAQADPRKQAVIVLYFHGNLGTEAFENALLRQRVVEQVAGSDVNAFLVAPYFGDVVHKHIGRFAHDDAFRHFIAEARRRLARLAEAPVAALESAPIMLVLYSGGHAPGRQVLAHSGKAIESVLMLDAAYNSQAVFAEKARNIHRSRKGFFLQMSSNDTYRRNREFADRLTKLSVPFQTAVPDRLGSGTIVVHTQEDAAHEDFVTQAWTTEPIRAVLQKAYGP